MGRFLKHVECDNCTSSDGKAVYEDGSTYCWVCEKNTQPRRSGEIRGKVLDSDSGGGGSYFEGGRGVYNLTDIGNLPCDALTGRAITKDTCTRFGVKVEYDPHSGEQTAWHAPLYGQQGELKGYAKRVLPKQMSRIGETSGTLPFGSHITGNSGMFLIVTEGVEDCLSAWQMLFKLGKNYRVVATLGTTAWKRNIEWFRGFEKVVIAFDKDQPGQEAAKEFATALGARARVAVWQGDEKDPDELARKPDGHTRFFECINTSQVHRPDGIITGEEVWQRMQSYTKPRTIPYPEEWELLNFKTEGIREGEISLWTAGSSVGKTSFVRRLKQHILTTTDEIIGEVELEESPEKTWRGMMQFHGRMPLSQMDGDYKRQVYEETYGTQRIFTVDHRNQFTRGQSLIGKFEYLHYSLGASIIFLDHITLAVSEFGDGGGLADQDRMMNEFLEFVEKTKCHLCIISHLRKAPSGGKSFEEGAVPSLDDLKGSGSLKQISFDVIGLSRNSQHPDPTVKNTTTLHVLKSRETGDTGKADSLLWCKDTMTFTKSFENPSPDGNGDDSNGDF